MSSVHAAEWGSGSTGGRWGHWAPQILIAAIVATVLLAAFPLPTGNPLVALTPLLLVAVVLITWVQMRRHDRSLCEHCLSSMPLNPSASAQRYRRRLAVAHVGAHRRVLVGYLVTLLAADVLVVVAPPALSVPATALWAATQASLVYLVLSHVTHRRLQPWCAQCGGGGGDDISSSDPVPSTSGSR